MSADTARSAAGETVGGVFLDADTLARLKGADDRRKAAGAWLAAIVKQSPGIRQALVVLAASGPVRFEPAAIWPEGAKAERALMASVEGALRAGRAVIQTLAANEGDGVAVAVPILIDGQLRGASGVIVAGADQAALRLVMDQLQWGAGWIEALVRRGRSAGGEGLVTVVELLATALHHRRFQEAATAVATELAGALGCERVAIGFLRGRRTRLRALSHSASFARKANLARAVEAAMDEAVDQQASIVTPPPEGAADRVIRAHEALMRANDVGAVCTVPLAEGRRQIGALLLERPAGRPFTRDEVLLCEHAAALIGPTLDVKRREDRWLPAKAWDAAGNLLTALIGPRHAALKLGALAVAGFAAFCWFATAPYRVTADAVVEGVVQRAVAAPVAGYLAESGVRAGDIVREGQILALLDVTDLRLERLKWQAQREKQRREYSEALAGKERARAGILSAQIGQADAQLALIDEQLARMRILAPFDGLVVSGDLSQALGAPVERGDVLFEIAPLTDWRVMLKVDERDVGDLAPGQTGLVALSAEPDRPMPVEVLRITPISTAEDGGNFFTVETRLTDSAGRLLRPGLEGVAKIEVEERRLIWIWTRRVIQWVRLFVWSWTP